MFSEGNKEQRGVKKKGVSCIRLFCHYVHKSLLYPGTSSAVRMNKEVIFSYLCWEFLRGKEREWEVHRATLTCHVMQIEDRTVRGFSKRCLTCVRGFMWGPSSFS